MVAEWLFEDLRRTVSAAWAFRWQVEREAELRFRSFADRLQQYGEPQPLVDMAEQAATDERRHAAHCQDIALAYGHPSLAAESIALEEIAPRGWAGKRKLLYEIVASCCVAETQSASVLLELLANASGSELEPILRELARDEMNHGRLGWAYLARAKDTPHALALAALVPGMLRGNAGADLFNDVPSVQESPELFRHGLLPHPRKRELFVQTAEEVIFPGLETLGVDAAPAKAWLREQLTRARTDTYK
jgi:rubrerythrin